MPAQPTNALKKSVVEFWDRQSCGEVYAAGSSLLDQLESQACERYLLEPWIHPFARFPLGAGKDLLEIGVGMGADHLEWARSRPRSLTGIDLTQRALEFTERRLAFHGLHSRLELGDAEDLEYPASAFDLVYSYGVLHHSPDTSQAIREVYRVLRPGGMAKVMIYHSRSVTGGILWARYALLSGRPFRSLADVYANHLESPGTKAFSIAEACALFAPFSSVEISVELGVGDLLEGAAGQRHAGLLLDSAKKLWPRWFIRRALANYGLAMLITAVK